MSIFNQSLPLLMLRIPALLLALTFHEVAHGYAAMRLGDPTARNLGRLSLNPLHHIDPIGALGMLLFGVGWAKPVPINSRYFKKPKRDMAICAAAGPAANFIMAFVGVAVYYLSAFLIGFRGNVISLTLESTVLQQILPSAGSFVSKMEYVWLMFLQIFILLNISLGVFNLIPVPPLDGSRIFLQFLPTKYYFTIMKYEQYIMLALFVLLAFDIVTLPLNSAVVAILHAFEWVLELIPIF